MSREIRALHAARHNRDGEVILGYRPMWLIDAIWQPFARESDGLLDDNRETGLQR